MYVSKAMVSAGLHSHVATRPDWAPAAQVEAYHLLEAAAFLSTALHTQACLVSLTWAHLSLQPFPMHAECHQQKTLYLTIKPQVSASCGPHI